MNFLWLFLCFIYMHINLLNTVNTCNELLKKKIIEYLLKKSELNHFYTIDSKCN
jgi:hypothetical protein